MVKTLYEVEQAIAQYQEHIRKLEQIIQEGTPGGREAAIAKLGEVRDNLQLLLKQRTRLGKDLAGYQFGQSMEKKALPILGLVMALAIIGLLFSSPPSPRRPSYR